jgi:type IX secretion system PorP/SprF family membrane protein
MRHLFSIIVLAGIFSSSALAQQIPLRSNYLMSTFQDHPAAAGNVDCLDLRFGVRNQWVGFEGAPTNSYATLTGRLSEGPRSVSGVGGRIETDQAGPWGTTSLSLAYSHKLKMNNGAWLSAGLALGVSQFRLNIGNLDFPDFETALDPAVTGSSQFIYPTVDAGLWYQDKTTFGGISLINATAATLNTITLGSETSRHVVITAGTSLELDGRFLFRPSTQMRITKGLPPSFEINGAVVYDNLLAIGIGYRSQSALVGSFQISLLDYLKVGYSYDFGISELRAASVSSHEITIAISAFNVSAPRGQHCSAYD